MGGRGSGPGLGGKRPTAGRRKGAMNLKTRAIAEKAMELGISPLEVMLDNMRFAHEGAQLLLGKLVEQIEHGGTPPPEKFSAYKEMLALRAVAQEAAKDAAPYMHPRLAAVELTGKNGGPVEIITKAQRDAAVSAASRADT